MIPSLSCFATSKEISPAKKGFFEATQTSPLQLGLEVLTCATVVHLIFHSIITLYAAGCILGCVIGILVKNHLDHYNFVNRSVRLLYELDVYSPIMKTAALVISLFLGIWSKKPAFFLSIGMGIWTGCLVRMKYIQAEMTMTQ